VDVRNYETADADDLWELKRAFETELGAGGDDQKETAYAEKLTDDYRTRWLGWVEECVAENPRTVSLGTVAHDDGDRLGGYVFLLPASLAFVWDAAVVNELYVDPQYRGTGLADELLSEAVAVARDQRLPLDRLLLDVDRENDRARAFYDAHGFEHWGEMLARPLDADD
jgi:Acetyltransferases